VSEPSSEEKTKPRPKWLFREASTRWTLNGVFRFLLTTETTNNNGFYQAYTEDIALHEGDRREGIGHQMMEF